MQRVAIFIAPKASAEGACILSKMGYYFRVWLVTEIVVCAVTVMLCYGIWVIHRVPNLGANWSRFLAVTLMMV